MEMTKPLNKKQTEFDEFLAKTQDLSTDISKENCAL